MAPSKAAGNFLLVYNSNALTGYLNQSTQEAIIAELPTTTLASTAEEKIPGLGSWSVSGGGPWDETLDGYLGPDAISPPSSLRTLVVTIGPSGAQSIYTYTNKAFITNYRVTAEPSGALVWTGTIGVTGAPVRS